MIRVFLLLSIVCSAVCSPADAVIIYRRGNTEPIKGRLVEETADQIVISVEREDGFVRKYTFARSEIEDILKAVSKDRLEMLSPEKPAEYRDYAEELSAKREDPDARDMAVRLYLIAASLAPNELGQSAMLGLIDLAEDDQQQRRYRAMAYLLDPDHDRAVLKESTVAPSTTLDAADFDARMKLTKTLHAIRMGDRRKAANLLRATAVKETIDRYRDFLSYEDLEEAAKPASRLTPGMLRRILMLELALEGASLTDDGVDEPAAARLTWGQVIATGQLDPLPTLSLETLVPGIDPRKSVFRDGKWEAPMDDD